MEEIDSKGDEKALATYKDVLLNEANRLREDNILCDITLCVDSRQFRANKALLAAASPFFRCLFTSKMSESFSDEVTLEGLNVEIMEDVLTFIYTGKINLTLENAQEIVKASDFLMIASLKEIGTDFLKQSLEQSNCFSVLEFAQKYGCNTLKNETIRFLCNHFMEMYEFEKFDHLDFEIVVKIFSSDNIAVSKEEKVFEGVMRWLRHDYKARKKHLEELFNCIRFPSISISYVKKMVLHDEIVIENLTCMTNLSRSLSSMMLSDGPPDSHNPRKCLLRDTVVIVCCGGYQSQGGNKDKRCFAYIPSINKVKSLKSMFAARAEHSTAVCGNLLYCMGTDGDKSSTAEVYNPRLNHWAPISRIPIKLNASSAVTLNEFIYLIGGNSGFGHSRRVYRYDPFDNHWTEVSSMHIAREELCSVAFYGFIYVFGGEGEDGQILRCAERYDPDLDRWNDIARMTRGRYCACATVVGEKVFVIGGHDGECVTSSCKAYNVEENRWSERCNTCVARHAAGVGTVEDKVYLIGGWDGNNYSDTIECYNDEENRWSMFGSIPSGKQAWIRCGVVRVPRNVLGI